MKLGRIGILCVAAILCADAAFACTDVYLEGRALNVKWKQSGRNLDCDVNLSPVISSYPAKMVWTTTDSEGKAITLGTNTLSFAGVSVLVS